MKIFKLLLTITIAIASLPIASFKSQSAIAAEKISFYFSVFGEFKISVEDLAVFAESGKITPEFAYYANRLDDQTRQQLRQILQTNFEIEPITVYRLTNMSMGEDFLRRLGNIIYTHPQRNGFYAIRSALIKAAMEPEGLTVINFLRHFPTDEMQIDIEKIFAIVNEAQNFFHYKDTTVDAIAEQARQEINSQTKSNFNNLPDLRQSGQHQVIKETLTFSISDLRQTATGFAGNYDLNIDIYTPEKLTTSAPLAIVTHGLGSSRSDFDYLAEHLASHGYIVAIPEHAGSSNNYQQAFLRGEVDVDVSPVEFYSRPRDITHLLNQLEEHPKYQAQINWSQIGVLGHSFGGTTALITSGAPVNLARVQKVCDNNSFILNVSLFLQCRASDLPPGGYDLQDERIKAVAAINPVTSSVLGIESMQQIEIPTLIVGGTKDFAAPFIEEQVHPFLWLTTPHKYLVTMVNGSHFSSVSETNMEGVNEFLKGFRADLGRDYLKGLTLAFFNAHLLEDPQSQSYYLTATYAEKISNPELPLHLIQSLTPQQLEIAYGDKLPTSPIPETIVVDQPSQTRDVLAEIERTGKLKVAIRTDAAPFGYQDDNNNLTGYCTDLATALGDRLSEDLNTPIEVVREPSSLSNRFELVEQNTVHLECGPNSITSDRQDVVFSDPFFSSGTRFLVDINNSERLDLNNQLDGMRLGVLEETKTKQYLKQNYPEAEIVTFAGSDGRSEGIQAVNTGKIDAMVSDRVLLKGEIDRQGLNRSNYQTIPEQPLTCDYYGLILPQGDPQWRNTVNNFIHDRTAKEVFDQWLNEYYSQAIADLNYCQNQGGP